MKLTVIKVSRDMGINDPPLIIIGYRARIEINKSPCSVFLVIIVQSIILTTSATFKL